MANDESENGTEKDGGSLGTAGKVAGGIGAVVIAVLVGIARHADDVGRGIFRGGRRAIRQADDFAPGALRNSHEFAPGTLRHSDDFAPGTLRRANEFDPRLGRQANDFSQWRPGASKPAKSVRMPWDTGRTDDISPFRPQRSDLPGPPKRASEASGPVGREAKSERAAESTGGGLLRSVPRVGREVGRHTVRQRANAEDEDEDGDE